MDVFNTLYTLYKSANTSQGSKTGQSLFVRINPEVTGPFDSVIANNIPIDHSMMEIPEYKKNIDDRFDD